MAVQSSGTISMADINIELGRASNAMISLNDAENGVYETINTDSSSRPSSTNPASMSEWYSYDHNATPPAPNSDIFGKGASSSSACGELALGLPFAQTLYWTGVFGVGTTLYNDSGLTSPFTGYDYVAYNLNTTVYTINSVTGQITSNTGIIC